MYKNSSFQLKMASKVAILSVANHFNGVIPDITILTASIIRMIDSNKLLDINLVGDVVAVRFENNVTGMQQASLENICTNHDPMTSPRLTSAAYDAMVDFTGRGDYLLPSEAFANGAMSVFVRPGVYHEIVDIVMPSGGVLVGEASAPATIRFAGDTGIKADGNNGVTYRNGTISVNKNSNVVNGTGTTFTQLTEGDYIFLRQCYFRIITILNDTTINVEIPYRGKAIVNEKYVAQPMINTIHISNICVKGSTGTGLYMRGVRSSVLDNLVLVENNIGIGMVSCGNTTINNLSSHDNNQDGMVFRDCRTIKLTNGDCYNNGRYGYWVAEQTKGVVFNATSSSGNGTHGIFISGASCKILINDCYVENNGFCGIRILENVLYTIIDGCIFVNNGNNGANIRGSDTIISSCMLQHNTGCGIKVSGTATRAAVDGNRILNCEEQGIRVDQGADYCVVSDNLITSCTMQGMQIGSGQSVITDNVTVGNALGIMLTATSSNLMVANNKPVDGLTDEGTDNDVQ